MNSEEKLQVKKNVLSMMDMAVDIEDRDVKDIIDRCIVSSDAMRTMGLNEKLEFKKELFNSLRRLDILSELLEDDSITEIMINGYRDIFIERNGRISKLVAQFESEERLAAIIQIIVSGCNRIVNEASPIVDARLSDGSRVNIVLPPIALNGPTMTIRKFSKMPMTMDRLIELGALSTEVAGFLRKLVVAGYNIMISGGTGSGKTTFLNGLSAYIPEDERVITIEDSAELKLINLPDLVSLEARNANVEGRNQVTIRDLIKCSLRMRPSRIVVGEIRDAAACDMLTAMNTGHDGSLSTAHANSCEDMLIRLETMVLMGMDMPLVAIKQQIASAVDIIIHLGRLRDKSRKVLEICEVIGMEGENIKLRKIYEFKEESCVDGHVVGELRKLNDLYNTGKLMAAGVFDIHDNKDTLSQKNITDKSITEVKYQ